MNGYNFKQRYSTAESASRLSALLGFGYEPWMQDWEVICADARRVNEFLDLYEKGNLCEDDQFALMALIVASLDDLLSSERADEATSLRVRQNLTANFKLHESTIHYWCMMRVDEPNPDYIFSVTPLMREIWKQFR
jgi:hypothetical protein